MWQLSPIASAARHSRTLQKPRKTFKPTKTGSFSPSKVGPFLYSDSVTLPVYLSEKYLPYSGPARNEVRGAALVERETICLAFLCHVHVRQLTSGYLDTTFAEIIIFTTFTTCFTKVSMTPSAVFPSSLAMFISQRASARFNSVPKTITVSES